MGIGAVYFDELPFILTYSDEYGSRLRLAGWMGIGAGCLSFTTVLQRVQQSTDRLSWSRERVSYFTTVLCHDYYVVFQINFDIGFDN